MDEILNKSGADLEGAPLARAPSNFCSRDRASDFVWAPRQKSMHQIAQIDFENYNFSQLLRGHIPLRSYETMGREHTCNVRKLQIEKKKKFWILFSSSNLILPKNGLFMYFVA